jgi:hypothetical protein
MYFYGHTSNALWPGGTLFVDQAMHLAFIGLFGLFGFVKIV